MEVGKKLDDTKEFREGNEEAREREVVDAALRPPDEVIENGLEKGNPRAVLLRIEGVLVVLNV